MSSSLGELAIRNALTHGNALLKVLSANDNEATRSHHAGYLLPRGAWKIFSPHPLIQGRLDKHPVRVERRDGGVTNSVITWYGSKMKYRLTGEMVGDFPWRTDDELGSLPLAPRLDVQDFVRLVQPAVN